MRIVFVAAAVLLLSFSTRSVSASPDPALPIRQIEFVGLRRISSETLRTRISSRVGQPLDRMQLEADVRALAHLEWFDSIRVETDSAADPDEAENGPGLRVGFRLEERPFLAGVEFRGSRALPHDRIQTILNEARIALPMAKPVNRTDLWHAARLLEHSLNDLGYPEAQVRVRLGAVPRASAPALLAINDGA